MRALERLVAILLLAAAGALIFSHLRLPGGERTFQIRAIPLRRETRIVKSMPSGPVDINHAGADELDALAGVGPAIAQRIIDEREQNGPFYYPEDLLSVDGIGPKTLEKLRDQICLQ